VIIMADTSTPYSTDGPAGKLLTETLKQVCPYCASDMFMVAEDCVDRNTLQAYETGYGAGGADVILFMCVACGGEFGLAPALFETAQ